MQVARALVKAGSFQRMGISILREITDDTNESVEKLKLNCSIYEM